MQPIVNMGVSFWQRACLICLVAVGMGLASLRLNDCDLFNPDSPRYVIYSQALVNLGEYRATDLPGSPLYSWRPPGLSMLLAPVMALRPYDVVAAKVVVLLCGGLMLWTMFELTSLYCGFRMAMLMTAVVATGPTFLVLSTEVLSEIPFTLGVLIVLLILARSTMNEVSSIAPQEVDRDEKVQRRRLAALIAATVVLAFVPWLRTAGVALVAAVGLWSMLSLARLRWLCAAVVATGGVGLLAWRNKLAAGENYVGSMFTRLRDHGFSSFVHSGFDTVWHYLVTAPGLLLPGLTSQRTSYAAMTLDGLPTLGVPFLIQAAIAGTLTGLALRGMWKQRAHGGSLSLLFVAVYFACLIVWPWRHERFLWPLIPVMLAYVPAGVPVLSPQSLKFGQYLISGGALMLVALCCWQSAIGAQLIQVNRELLRDRLEFHATRYPGFYFSNWRRAGEWLHENSPPSSRVLTWHAAVAGTSHRFQKRVQFETLSPEKIRQQIERFSARYLVVPDGQFGDGFGWQQLEADPGLQLKVVYREQDVAVLEVIPNRSGIVSKTAYPEWLDEQLRLISEARERLPHRTDLAMRHASLLRESGQDQQAIQILRKLFDEGIITARVCAELGWLLYDAGDFAEAARFLELAKTQPNAESIAAVLAEGVTKANERLREKSAGKSRSSVDRQISRVKNLLGSQKFAAAEREAERALAEHADHPELLYLRGKIHHRLGELSQAESNYQKAIALGFVDAQSLLLLIRIGEIMERGIAERVESGNLKETIDPADPAAHVRWSRLLQDHGWAGRALAVLEQANERFPDQPSIELPLADLYRYFARPDLAVAVYEKMTQHDPSDIAARKGLDSIQGLLIEPDMEPVERSHQIPIHARSRETGTLAEASGSGT